MTVHGRSPFFRCPGGARQIAFALLLTFAASSACALDLPTLMARLGQQRAGEAVFTEQRFVSGFDEPLVSSGTLSFAAPDHFVRQTLQPRPETLGVDGNTVSVSRGGRHRSYTLDAVPELVGLIEALRGTLTGNAQTLGRYFKPSLVGSLERWTLSLTPLEVRLGRQVRLIHITGQQASVDSIEIELAGGDRSLMLIEPMPAERATAKP